MKLSSPTSPACTCLCFTFISWYFCFKHVLYKGEQGKRIRGSHLTIRKYWKSFFFLTVVLEIQGPACFIFPCTSALHAHYKTTNKQMWFFSFPPQVNSCFLRKICKVVLSNEVQLENTVLVSYILVTSSVMVPPY